MITSIEKEFSILGIQQIAIGNINKDSLATLWVDLLGLPKTSSFKSTSENVDEDILTLGKGAHAIEIDLMQPINPDQKPKVHEPPLNHFGLWVDDLENCVAYLTQKKVRFTPGGIRKGASGHDVCFIHPKSNTEFPIAGSGVLIELIQAPPNVIKALSQQ